VRVTERLGSGVFLRRPNRFLVEVLTRRGVRRCHLRDPGRLKELLVPGATVVFIERDRTGRKTSCEVLLIWDGKVWTVVNSRLHLDLAEEVLLAGLFNEELGAPKKIRREVRFGRSRLDLLLDESTLVEIKGCTLVREGVALFPDAPTERGRRHVLDLVEAVRNGYRAAVLFLIMRPDAEVLKPNWSTDPEFSRALAEAVGEGVIALAVKFRYCCREIRPAGRVPVITEPKS